MIGVTFALTMVRASNLLHVPVMRLKPEAFAMRILMMQATMD